MTTTVTLDEAKEQLGTLLDKAASGDTVVITVDGEARAFLSAIRDTLPMQRKPGGWEGQVWMAEDFDDLPDDLAKAFRGEGA